MTFLNTIPTTINSSNVSQLSGGNPQIIPSTSIPTFTQPPQTIPSTSIPPTSIPSTFTQPPPAFTSTSIPPTSIPTSTPSTFTQPPQTIPSTSTPTSSTFTQPIFAQSPTSNTPTSTSRQRGAKQTAAITKLTPTYSISTANAASLEPYHKLSRTTFTYTDILLSPYYTPGNQQTNSPVINHLICQPDAATNLMLFDNCLLSVKLNKLKYKVQIQNPANPTQTQEIEQEQQIYQVSIEDLKKYYSISSKALTAFKNHYKIPTPSTSTTTPSSTSTTATQIIYNTNPYPLTDKGGKWLTISYLIPFLFFTVPNFANHYSNIFFHYLVAISYNPPIPQPSSAIQNLQQAVESCRITNYRGNVLPDLKFKPNPKSNDATQPATTTPKAKPVHKLIIQQPKLIIPQMITADQISQQTFNSVKQSYNIETLLANPAANFDRIKEFYSHLNPKEFNPADMLYISSIIKADSKFSLTPQISIGKIDPSSLDPAGNIIDPKVITKLQGVKEKKNKNGTIITSQPTCDYYAESIAEEATLQNLFKYAQELQASGVNQIQTSQGATGLPVINQDLKSIKTKIAGDMNLFHVLIALPNQTITRTVNTNGMPQQQDLKFTEYLKTLKKTPVRKPKAETNNDVNDWTQDGDDNENDDNESEVNNETIDYVVPVSVDI